MKKTLNIAHRGASGDFPENTMIAFKEAIKLGADGIEIDVQMTKDLKLVVIHDETVDRTTNGQGLVKNFLFEDIRKLDAGRGEKIPELREVIELFRENNLVLNIELKNSIVHYEGIEEKVLKLITEEGIKSRVIISSFNHYSIKTVRELDNEVKVGALVEASIYEPEKYISGLKVQCYHPQYKSLNSEIVLKLKENNIEINTYTVNEEDDMKWLASLNVESIITNYPKKLKEILARK